MDSNKRLQIGFLSEFDPMDRKASSGTNFKCAEELSRLGTLFWIPCKKTLFGKISGRISFLINKFLKKNYFVRMTKRGASLCFSIPHTAELNKYDVIIAFFCSSVLSKIETSTPVVYLSDATFPVLIDYYPAYSNISKKHKSQILNMEKCAYSKAAKLVLASDWAASGAKILGVNQDKIEVIEYGANLDNEDIEKSQNASAKISRENVNCLFLGVDWKRKGGQIAVEAVNWLNRNGVKAKLNIVGCNPTNDVANNPNIDNLGFLNKNIPADYNKLIETISTSDILLLPTKAECAGIVFAESSAYGLPIFTYDTGGVPNYVINGINGYRLPMGASGDEFGKRIKETLSKQELSNLAEGGKRLYEEKLNWTCWRNRMEIIIKDLVGNH